MLVAVVTAAASGTLWLIGRKRAIVKSRNAEIIKEIQKYLPGGASLGQGKHKKRKGDGILLANISMDFLNQFPVPVAALAAHADRLYTPENFGESDWLSVFRRLATDGYFEASGVRSPKRITVETLLRPGPLLQSWLETSTELKRGIAGLE